jgi:hypothetical protein
MTFAPAFGAVGAGVLGPSVTFAAPDVLCGRCGFMASNCWRVTAPPVPGWLCWRSTASTTRTRRGRRAAFALNHGLVRVGIDQLGECLVEVSGLAVAGGRIHRDAVLVDGHQLATLDAEGVGERGSGQVVRDFRRPSPAMLEMRAQCQFPAAGASNASSRPLACT